MNHRKLIKEYCIIHIVCILAILMTAGYLLLQQKKLLSPIPCVFLELTHLYCPGCGGTRAVIALLHGNILQSLRFNPAVFLGIIVIIYYEVCAIITIIKNNGRCYYNKYGIPLYVYLVIIVIFAVVRDIILVRYGIDWLA